MDGWTDKEEGILGVRLLLRMPETNLISLEGQNSDSTESELCKDIPLSEESNPSGSSQMTVSKQRTQPKLKNTLCLGPNQLTAA